jgi:cell division protein FtsL
MNTQQQTIQRYLLGELPETEQEILERKYFADPIVFEQIVQVENDLADRYARGLLSPNVRDRFEKYYLAHPERRSRARFAEALVAKLDQDKEVQATQKSWFASLSALLRGPKLARAFSIAILLFAVLTGWFFIETRRLRQELARTETERLTREARDRQLEKQVADEKQRVQKLADELEALRAQQDTDQPAPSPEAKPSSTLATLILTIGGARGAENGQPGLLEIPSGAEQVRVQLNLRENNYAVYQIVLQSADGNTAFTSRQLTASNKKSGATLAVIIPAQKLSTGDYILTLRGSTATGEFEDVSKSLFHVEEK